MQPAMPSSMCMRCLKRSLKTIDDSFPTHTTYQRAAAFSTTASSLAKAPVKKAVGPQGRTLRLTKNTRTPTTRPPAIGERRELRKRVVLSNTNALEVRGLLDFNWSNTRHVNLKFNNGAVMGLTDVTIDSLRGLEAFKPTQGWNLFRRPATLVRTETIDLAGDLDRITDEKLTVRKVLYGERGSGKSVLQIQALAIASLNNWLVVHIPEAKDLANAHTSYEPIETPDGIQYIQPHYTAQLLGKIAQTNNTVLSKLTMLEKHRLPITLDPSATLADLAQAGAKDPEISWPIWQALWKELLIKGKRRPRILYSLDGIDHVMRLSAYLNRDLQPIHAHELTLVKQYMDFLAGRIPMPNGGMVLAATSESNRAAAHTLDHCLKRRWALQNGQEPPRWDPYVAHDKWVQEVMESPAVVKLEGLSKKEARGVMEYYARSGVLRSAVTDGLVSETWTLAGGGIIGQVEKASLRTHF